MSERWILAAAALAVTGWVARFRPPPADPAFTTALADTFALLGPEPRPVGSAAHARARVALGRALREAGGSVTELDATVCGRWGRCARVHDLVARFGPPGPAIALVAHYDTVAAAPGAADDGAGVAAALDVARRIGDAPPARGVWVVLTDAEELGLLGARAWVQTAPDVAAVVNLEARGTAGPSLLFETTGAPGPLVARFARVARRPFTSSLFDAVYELLPNDTDLTELAALGVPGYNLAFIGRPLDYHTPGDAPDRLSVDSAAHQAGNARALVDAWVADPGPAATAGGAVWFDLFGA
ncbi:MAG: M20/M25/M40 family metallo-hydrolase, partial [Myxococcota bacterium]